MRNLMAGLTIVCLALCLCAIPQAALDPSLVLYFDFEGGGGNTVEDRSDYGNDGTIEGNAVWVDGKLGKGLEIDISSFVLVPDSDDFKITDELTLACWAKSTAFAPEAWQGNSLDFLVCRWNWAQGNNRCYETLLDVGAPRFVITSDGTDATATGFTSPDAIDLDKWVNIVGVFDGSKVTVYADGEEMGSADHEGNIVDGETPIIIGDNNDGIAPDFRFVGVMDEVAVYNRVLSQDEIKQKMTSGHVLAVESQGKLSTTWGDIKFQYHHYREENIE